VKIELFAAVSYTVSKVRLTGKKLKSEILGGLYSVDPCSPLNDASNAF